MVSTKNVKCLKNSVLPFFFKFSCNLDNASPLVIPLKFQSMASLETNLSGSKVESNSKSRRNNLCNAIGVLKWFIDFHFAILQNVTHIAMRTINHQIPNFKKFRELSQITKEMSN
jgi:hypothetical protein